MIELSAISAEPMASVWMVGRTAAVMGMVIGYAVLPLVNDARIPFFAPFTGAQGLREPFNRYVFNIRAGYFDETATDEVAARQRERTDLTAAVHKLLEEWEGLEDEIGELSA